MFLFYVVGRAVALNLKSKDSDPGDPVGDPGAVLSVGFAATVDFQVGGLDFHGLIGDRFWNLFCNLLYVTHLVVHHTTVTRER